MDQTASSPSTGFSESHRLRFLILRSCIPPLARPLTSTITKSFVAYHYAISFSPSTRICESLEPHRSTRTRESTLFLILSLFPAYSQLDSKRNPYHLSSSRTHNSSPSRPFSLQTTKTSDFHPQNLSIARVLQPQRFDRDPRKHQHRDQSPFLQYRRLRTSRYHFSSPRIS